MNVPNGVITQLLKKWSGGSNNAFHDLIDLVHEELSQISRNILYKDASSSAYQSQELVNQAFFSLSNKQDVQWRDRRHFFNMAARSMRRALIVEARRVQTEKRGHGLVKELEIKDEWLGELTISTDELVLLNQVLDELESQDPDMATTVTLRFFCGFSVEEAALIMDVSTPTVKRRWAFAKSWLRGRLET